MSNALNRMITAYECNVGEKLNRAWPLMNGARATVLNRTPKAEFDPERYSIR